MQQCGRDYLQQTFFLGFSSQFEGLASPSASSKAALAAPTFPTEVYLPW
jgi:hypothetical protein